jgi:diaminopimelate decarboxylase
MDSKAVQAALAYFEVKDNELIIGGRSVREWSDDYQTPFYLYDMSVVDQKVQIFRQSMPDDVKLLYAVKANPNQELLEHMIPLVDGFDVASKGELEAVVQAGGKPETVSFAGPGKREGELQRSIELGIGSINIESERELDIICRLAEHAQARPRVSIRINPDFELHGSGMKMGGGAKQFGIDAEMVPEILQRISNLPVDFQGFHVYAGSQNLSAETIVHCLQKTLELMDRLAGDDADKIELVNLGGGFGIPYYEKDEELDIDHIGQSLESLLLTYRSTFPRARFVIELGRYLVGESGMYVTRVLDKKRSRGKIFLVTDGGMNHHLAASGNFGQVIKKNFPMVASQNLHSRNMEAVDVVGPLCTPLDHLGRNVYLPLLKEGELLSILCSGAYGFSASPLLFLSHKKPKQIISS